MAPYDYGESDHVASDDMDSILEYTRQLHESSRAHLPGSVHAKAGPSHLGAYTPTPDDFQSDQDAFGWGERGPAAYDDGEDEDEDEWPLEVHRSSSPEILEQTSNKANKGARAVPRAPPPKPKPKPKPTPAAKSKTGPKPALPTPAPTNAAPSAPDPTSNGSGNPNPTPNANANANAVPQSRLTTLDAEISACEADIAALQARVGECKRERAGLVALIRNSNAPQLIRNSDAPQAHPRADGVAHANGYGKGTPKEKESVTIDYSRASFEWTLGLKAKMRSVFGIEGFRLCQEGVCNANMDCRDIVCIMPTGGGKSLTYQLPALLMTGCTLVISPLISLMTDQVMHLRDVGVEAAMLMSTTKDSEKKEIIERLRRLAERRVGVGEREVKLVYVTPEKMSKDKSFRSLLQRIDAAGKFARIVIDEAHCVSQMGHDFRKDYKELHILRKIFPRVPIMALSATCGPRVLQDLIATLGLGSVVSGSDAPPHGTLLFSAPLYRKNLHYHVVPKPDSAREQYELMKEFILGRYEGCTGIVYCLSKKDTELVAEKLRELSGGRIKTGVYHSEVAPAEKERLHTAWREGRVKVVCATIAFGMGIDKGDVRFVLHHSISKSLEGYYQESGRAGRDGNDSDCVLYYRPQDASTLTATATRENDGADKLHAVLDFAEEVVKCRKVMFAEYFSHSSQSSVASWSTAETSALERCGHCDNCTRAAGSIDKRDVTLASWQLLKILQAVRAQGGKMTLGKLAALARGSGKGAYDVATGTGGRGRRKETETVSLDFERVCGGTVDLSKSDVEHLIVRLLTRGFFQEEYQQTAYSMNVYIAPGKMAARLNYQNREAVEEGRASIKYEFDFGKPQTKARKAKAKSGDAAGGSKATKSRKGKEKAVVSDDEDDMYASDSDPGRRAAARRNVVDNDEEEEEEEGESFDWSFTMRDEPQAQPKPPKPMKEQPRPRPVPPRQAKRKRASTPLEMEVSEKPPPAKRRAGVKASVRYEDDHEVLELSSD